MEDIQKTTKNEAKIDQKSSKIGQERPRSAPRVPQNLEGDADPFWFQKNQ